MKKKKKQWLSFCLVIIILLTSGIIPKNIINMKAAVAETSLNPGKDYPYYCSNCKYYYTENKLHWCKIPKSCQNCNGIGHFDTTHTCTACENGTVYCTNLSTYFSENTQINDTSSETKFAFSWSCGYCNDSSSGTFTMSGVNSGYLHTPTVVRKCEDCSGTGTAYDKYTVCNGTGKIVSNEVVGPNRYRVTFDANGGVLSGPDHIYGSGYSLNVTVSASKSGYDFLGWSTNKDATSPDPYPILNSPKTLYAIFACRSNVVTLDSQGASDSGTTSVNAMQGNEMPLITIPRKEYIVSFDKNTVDSSVSISDNFIRDVHVFQGYYTETNGNGIKYYNMDGSSTRNWDETRDITLYAFWKDQGIILPAASRTGYTFQGWATSSTGSSGIAAGEYYKTDTNITLYAIWSKNTYTIHYDLTGGSIETANPTSYNVKTETFSLNSPVRDGYIFAGWTGSNGTEKQINVSITKGSVGDRSYTASWIAKTDIPYKIEIYKMGLDGIYPLAANETKNATGTVDIKVSTENIAKKYNYSGFSYENAKIGQEIATEMKIDGKGTSVLKLFYKRN